MHKRSLILAVCLIAGQAILAEPVAQAGTCRECLASIKPVCAEECRSPGRGPGRACEETCAARNCTMFCSGGLELDGAEPSGDEKRKLECQQCFQESGLACSRRCSGLRGERGEACSDKCLSRKCGKDCSDVIKPATAPETEKNGECIRCEQRRQRSCERSCSRLGSEQAPPCVQACLAEKCGATCR